MKPLPVWKRILFELAAAYPKGLTRRDLELAVGVGTAVTERIRLDIRPWGYKVDVERRRDSLGKLRYYYLLGADSARYARRVHQYREWAKSRRGVTRVSS